jgi:hypothetical protein
MSGGYFDYQHHYIKDMYDDIQYVIDNKGKPNEDGSERWSDHLLTEEVIMKLKAGIYYLKMAYAYTHRIDRLLSYDDGEESFLRRLREDLNELRCPVFYTENLTNSEESN